MIVFFFFFFLFVFLQMKELGAHVKRGGMHCDS